MATVGRACLILALARRASTASAPRCTARAPGGATGSTPAGAPSTRWPALLTRRLRGPRDRVPALGLLASTSSPTHSSTDDADLLPRRRGVVLAGGLAAAVGVAAVAVVEPRAVPRRAGGCATSRPTRRRCCSASARFFTGAARLRGQRRSRTLAPAPAGGRRAQPAAAPPEHDDPPADAVLGVHAVRGPVRVRDRRAGRRGGVDAEWIRATRRFALAAWFFLGIGILLGARWSYTELGWGGYWAWDPVENASLMPWLTGTAFLHSVMIQEKRGMLKVWNVVAGARDRHAGDPRHVPRALGDPRLDPRLRRLDARRAVRVADRR